MSEATLSRRHLLGAGLLTLTPPGIGQALPELPNPLIPQRADPHVLRHTDGWLYLMATVPAYDRLELRRARSLAGLATAEAQVVWRRHEQGPMSRHIWAPELHVIDGRWFIYFSAGEARDPWKIRLWALENTSPDPLQGAWIERGQIKTAWETFTLDATVFEHRGQRYMAWAQTDPAAGNHSTDLYLSRMKSPTELSGPQVRLSRPEYAWEQVRHAVNEAPAVLIHGGRVFMSYSAAGTGAEYCLGLLWADADADVMNPASWRKSPGPVFASSAEHGIYGPGHNSFLVEPDGTVLNVYHARNYRDISGDPLKDTGRATRVQPVRFTADGMPDFGLPRPETARP
ncbi:family 43 glycosylhydrolase [Roseateles puraquae]|uniref:Alpha-N-arabinofuranosidase n=1 Tax=Roseateles puraquae TaxID=431059 RepID=A0A254NEB8_9BURK|nr:family 43 glycosylhydrolase [Roseateles puraquae]MDG0856898.1 alpha-N-arabinofuranosidase [Roseateles puraquae]MDG0856923.1 alpha-N-arabinofuranosidase [Roseateles puraquae]OWR05964.1 alpha-N-arabinofuranosidase [Roseateles puraquae]